MWKRGQIHKQCRITQNTEEKSYSTYSSHQPQYRTCDMLIILSTIKTSFRRISPNNLFLVLYSRSYLGIGVVAQRPDCSRVVEMLVTRRCKKVVSDKSKKGKVQPQFDAVLARYTSIWDAILEQPLNAGSGIQLPHLNQHRIREWWAI